MGLSTNDKMIFIEGILLESNIMTREVESELVERTNGFQYLIHCHRNTVNGTIREPVHVLLGWSISTFNFLVSGIQALDAVSKM